MKYIALLNKESLDLYQRWLRENDTVNLTVLVCKDKLVKVEEIHKDKNLNCPVHLVPFRQEDKRFLALNQDLDISESDTVVLPTFFKKDPAKFIENAVFPKIQDNYHSIRQLWHIGFRHFQTYNFEGLRTYYIPNLLDEFVDKYEGQRCFVIGNGPSLNQIDMQKLRNEITFGSNRCYFGFEKWNYQFTYWGIVDRLQIEHYQYEYEENVPADMVKFYPFQYHPLFNFENSCPVPHKFGIKPDQPQFSLSPDMLYLGWSVSFFLIQIAAIMGFKEIILLGMDHNYSLDQRKMGMIEGNRWYDKNPFTRKIAKRVEPIFNPNKGENNKSRSQLWKASDAGKATHFDDRYTKGENKLFVPPRPVYAENAYRLARQIAEENGIEILNATPGTKLEEFKKINFETLF
jgi:hypothetical protein